MPKKLHDGLKKRCGCPRRRWASCTHPWHFTFCHEGREYRFSLASRATTADGSMSKSEAESIRDALRIDIRAGKLTTTGEPIAPEPDLAAPLTLGDVLERYDVKYVASPTRRASAIAMIRHRLKLLRGVTVAATGGGVVRLVDKPLMTITKADVEAVRENRRAALAEGRRLAQEIARIEADNATKKAAERVPVPPEWRAKAGFAKHAVKDGEVGANRLLARLRHVFNWAIAEGYVSSSPFTRHGVSVVRLATEAEGHRTRRLQPGEEDQLLRHAGDHLRALIIAALSTGCRVGELLSLQWRQVRFDASGAPAYVDLPAMKTKTCEPRIVPVGGRLRAVLDMRRLDPAGLHHQPDAYVFGNEVGERIASIKTAWAATCRRAGIEDLHFHDLRREFACRLLEARAELHDVQSFLGHANITTTSTYLRSTPLRLAKALERMEEKPIEPDKSTPAEVPYVAH